MSLACDSWKRRFRRLLGRLVSRFTRRPTLQFVILYRRHAENLILVPEFEARKHRSIASFCRLTFSLTLARLPVRDPPDGGSLGSCREQKTEIRVSSAAATEDMALFKPPHRARLKVQGLGDAGRHGESFQEDLPRHSLVANSEGWSMRVNPLMYFQGNVL